MTRRNYIRFVHIGFGVIVLMCSAVLAIGQAMVSVTGTVTDKSGGAIPNAKVTITEIDTGQSRTVKTDQTGTYSFLQLSQGNYKVSAQATGFETVNQAGLVLHVGDQPKIDLALPVGAVTTTVEVQGAAPIIETSNAVGGGVISNQSVESLPLNGRGFEDLAVLQANVNLATTGARTTNTGFGEKISIGGARPTASTYTLDGQDIDNFFNDIGNVSGEAAGIDAVEEYKVVTNPLSAEYGRTAGGQIQIVTKTGTSKFHGSGYDFIRNSWVDARNYFDPLSGPPPLIRNQFGASLGGPIKKDRAFFFFNYEGLRNKLGSTTLFTTPDANARMGIIGTAAPIVISPKVLPYLNPAVMPLPTQCPCGNGYGRVPLVDAAIITDNYYLGRVDYNITDKEKIFVRYSQDTGQNESPKDFVFHNVINTRTKYTGISLQSLFSSKVVNTVGLFYNRSVSLGYDIPRPGVAPATSALFDLTSNINVGNRPVYMFYSPGSGTTIGGTNILDNIWMNNYQGRDDFNWQLGKHTLRIGVNAEGLQSNLFNSVYGGGDFSFSTLQSFLTAQPSTYSVPLPGSILATEFWQWIVGSYVQDDYKATSKLTFTLGLRYEPTTVPNERHGHVSSLHDYTSPGLTIADATLGNPLFQNPSKENFSPRIGIAYNPIPSTVVRAGYGMFYDLITGAQWRVPATSAPPFFSRDNIRSSQVGLIDFPNAFYTDGPILTSAIAFDTFQNNAKQPKIQEYTLTIEKQIGATRAFTIMYAGASGRDLTTVTDWNDTRSPCGVMPDGGPLAGYPTFCADSTVQSPTFDWIKVRNTNGKSFYNSLSTTFQQRFHNGLLYRGSWTWAKSIDTTSLTQGGSDFSNEPQGPYRDPYAPGGVAKDSQGLSAFNVPNSVTMNALYQLPWGRDGKRGFSNGVVNALGSGWSISGLGQLQGGPPFSVAGDASGAQRNRTGWPSLDNAAGQSQLPPNYSGTPVKYHHQATTGYYSVDSFVLPPIGQYGDVNRHSLNGPGVNHFDFAAQKETAIAEGLRIQLRLDLFNAFNRPNFGLPNPNLFVQSGTCPPLKTGAPNLACVGNVTFNPNAQAGSITTTTTTSRQFQGAVKLIF
jgi:outer membrane receptor protein involved in Fe transport